MIQTLLDDLNENPENELIYSNYGLYPALCYRGSDLFIKKITNLIVNYSILKRGEFYSFYHNFNYILAPEERIINGIKNCIRNEILQNHDLYSELEYVSKINEETDEIELTWNEEILELLTNEQTEAFWVNKIKKINLLNSYGPTESTEEFKFGEIESIKELSE